MTYHKTLRAPAQFENEEQAKVYIHDCEARFRHKVISLTRTLCADESLHLVGMSGPSCAGKTTTAKLLVDQLEQAGRHVHMISVDDFFLEQPHAMDAVERGEEIDFDSVDALDVSLFEHCLDQLMHRGHTEIPAYDLSCGLRKGTQTVSLRTDRDVFLIEGIQVVYPEISKLLHRYSYRSIFANVDAHLMLDHIVYAPEDIRLMRRLVRDYYFRSSDAEFTFYLWKNVRKNELKNILPHGSECEIAVNSLMGYEVGMLRPHLERIFKELPADSEYREQADTILSMISHVMPLDNAWLPPDSLYREFVPLA